MSDAPCTKRDGAGDILIVAAFACVDRKRQAGLIGKVKQ